MAAEPETPFRPRRGAAAEESRASVVLLLSQRFAQKPEGPPRRRRWGSHFNRDLARKIKTKFPTAEMGFAKQTGGGGRQ